MVTILALDNESTFEEMDSEALGKNWGKGTPN